MARKNKGKKNAQFDAWGNPINTEGDVMENAAVAPAAAEEPVAPKKPKRKNDMMSSVLHESVVETMQEEFQANEPFTTEKDGVNYYVGLFLNTEDVGGLSKKSKKDEQKGSAIECINNGRIKTYINADLMEKECLIIIPDALTVDAMMEYSFLTTAPYKLALIDSSLNYEVTEFDVTFDEVVNVVQSEDGTVDDIFAAKGADWVFEEEEPIEEESTEFEDVWSDGEDVDEDAFNEFTGETGEEEIPEDTEYYDEEDIPPLDEDYQGEEYYDEDEDFYDEDEEEQEIISEDDFEEAVVRTFYSDDLGLEVSTEAFDAQFIHGNPYVPFDENRGEGWLNEQLNEMSKLANAEMTRVHQMHIFQMREKYFSLISACCDEIQSDLDTENPNTYFGKAQMQIDSDRAVAEQKRPSIIAQRRKELEDRWNEDLERVGNDAKAAAQQHYRERYGRQHEADVMNLEGILRNKEEEDYQNSLREMNDLRRKEAGKRLDYVITATLAEISKMYLKALDEEQVIYEGFRQDIYKFLDENRKDDIARTKILAEELAQNERADAVRAEYKERLATQTQEFETKRIALQSELEKMERDNENRLKAMETDCNNRLVKLQEDLANMKAERDSLLAKYEVLDEKKDKEYQSRMLEYENERRSWEEKCQHIMATHKRNTPITIALCVVAVVAALAIGLLFGLNSNLNKSHDKPVQQSGFVQEVPETSTTLPAPIYQDPVDDEETTTEKATEPQVDKEKEKEETPENPVQQPRAADSEE